MAFRARLKMIDDSRLRSLLADTGKRAEAWAQETAENVLEEARVLMESSGGGVQYPGLPNRSSAPGEAPAVQSGQLISSGEARGQGSAVIVAFTAEHAPYMEFGTSTIAPRPFLRPAVDKERPKALIRARKIIR